MKLAYKILLISLLPLIGTTTILILINSYLTRQVVERHVQTSMAEELGHQVNNIEDFFAEQIRALKIMGAAPQLQSGDLSRILPFLRRQEEHLSPLIEGLYFNQLDGMIYGAKGEEIDVSDRYYFPFVKKAEVVVSRVIVSRATQRPIVLTLAPVYSDQGQHIGAVAASIRVESLVEAALEAPLGERGFAALVDESGNVVAPKFTPSSSLYSFTQESREAQKDGEPSAFADLVQEIRRQGRGMAKVQFMGETYQVQFAPIKFTSWSLALLFNEDELLAGGREIRESSMYVIIAAVVFLFLFVYVFARSFLRPVYQLIAGHRSLAKGEYGVQVPAVSDDEFGELTDSFNEMSRRLKEVYEDRQKFIDDQTHLIAIIENTTDMVALLDSSLRFYYINKAGRDLLGLSENEDICDYHLDDVLDDSSQREFFYETERKGTSPVRVWHQELCYRTKTEEVPVSQVTVRHLNSERGTAYFSVIARDITESKKAAEELTSAKERAETADRAKTEFLATISHELRTPIQGVLGAVDVIREEEVPEEVAPYIDMIERSGRSLLSIVNDILDISSFVRGKIRISQERFRLREVVESSLSVVKTTADNKGLDLVTEVSEQFLDEPLLGDPARLRQVLINLLGNAVKFTYQGEVRLVIEEQGRAEDRTWVRMEVRDTGPGIPPEAQHKIFEEFYQADSTISRSFGGVGLGLAICKRFVELMGGNIGFDSELNRGSTFWLEIPFLRAEVRPYLERTTSL